MFQTPTHTHTQIGTKYLLEFRRSLSKRNIRAKSRSFIKGENQLKNRNK